MNANTTEMNYPLFEQIYLDFNNFLNALKEIQLTTTGRRGFQ